MREDKSCTLLSFCVDIDSVTMMMMITIIINIVSNDFNDLVPSNISLIPVRLSTFIIDNSAGLLNSFPVSSALFQNGA